MRDTRSSRIFRARLHLSRVIASSVHSLATRPVFLCGIAVGVRVLEWDPTDEKSFEIHVAIISSHPFGAYNLTSGSDRWRLHCHHRGSNGLVSRVRILLIADQAPF